MKQISILGCGWLGLPLAKKLLEEGYTIKGSTTTETKIQTLEQAGIIPYLMQLGDTVNHASVEQLTSFLENSSVLIINIPPKIRTENRTDFVQKMNYLLPFIEQSLVKTVVFVSSTSVYLDGADYHVPITESTTLMPDTENGKQLLEAEQLLGTTKKFQTIVLRFGGLIGADRHPITFLAGRKNLENPDAPINLIHQEDCIAIVAKLLQKEGKESTVFNAVAPYHPTRKEYYTQKAKALQLPLPEFKEEPSVGKQISSEKLQRAIAYTFQQLS